MVETELITPRGTHTVRRPHTKESTPLRGWSAADQLVLDHLGAGDLGSVLIVNDEFGALTAGLADAEPTVWSDSALSRGAVIANLSANGIDPSTVTLVPGDQVPAGTYDTVIVRVPKTNSLLELQLRAIGPLLRAGATVIGTGMARHIHTNTLSLFENFVGVTTTSRATRKARLIHVELAAVATEHTLSETSVTQSFVTGAGVRVSAGPGVFSAGYLDVGSALLLDILATVEIPVAGSTVIDLGCGNGVLGATLAQQWKAAQFVLVDVSDLAVAAARRTWELNDLDAQRCTAVVADGLRSVADRSADVVITNPPFHEGHALDRELTDRLLADTARVLKPSGVAYVVVQRHLQLHTKMKQWFAEVEITSKHPTHVVLVATKPRKWLTTSVD